MRKNPKRKQTEQGFSTGVLQASKSTTKGEYYVSDYSVSLIPKCLIGTVVNETYKLGDLLNRGSGGPVLSGVHLQTHAPVAFKIMTKASDFVDYDAALSEVMKATEVCTDWQQEECPIPFIVDRGLFFQLSSTNRKRIGGSFTLATIAKGDQLEIEQLKSLGKVNHYLVFPQYEMSLAQYFEKQQRDLSIHSILDLGCRLIRILKIVHKAGFVYNDLEPENIMINFESRPSLKKSSTSVRSSSPSFRRQTSPVRQWTTRQKSCFEGANLFLIDYRSCTPYKDRRTGKHFGRSFIEYIPGNIRFASSDQLTLEKTSRKDDIISLCYLLIFLLNKGDFLDNSELARPFVRKMNRKELIQWLKEFKRLQSLSNLCDGRAWFLKPFVEKAFSLNYASRPPYEDLIEILEHEQVCFSPRQIGNASKFGDSPQEQSKKHSTLRGFSNLQFVKNSDPDWMTVQPFVESDKPFSLRLRDIRGRDKDEKDKKVKAEDKEKKGERRSVKDMVSQQQMSLLEEALGNDFDEGELSCRQRANQIPFLAGKSRNAGCTIPFFSTFCCSSKSPLQK